MPIVLGLIIAAAVLVLSLVKVIPKDCTVVCYITCGLLCWCSHLIIRTTYTSQLQLRQVPIGTYLNSYSHTAIHGIAMFYLV